MCRTNALFSNFMHLILVNYFKICWIVKLLSFRSIGPREIIKSVYTIFWTFVKSKMCSESFYFVSKLAINRNSLMSLRISHIINFIIQILNNRFCLFSNISTICIFIYFSSLLTQEVILIISIRKQICYSYSSVRNPS